VVSNDTKTLFFVFFLHFQFSILSTLLDPASGAGFVTNPGVHMAPRLRAAGNDDTADDVLGTLAAAVSIYLIYLHRRGTGKGRVSDPADAQIGLANEYISKLYLPEELSELRALLRKVCLCSAVTPPFFFSSSNTTYCETAYADCSPRFDFGDKRYA
jgi:hypothetical protein